MNKMPMAQALHWQAIHLMSQGLKLTYSHWKRSQMDRQELKNILNG